jgi:23S rRNA (pseudouridine1915-N3)-methyltransferase
MRIRIIWEGKTKDPNLRALQSDYVHRLACFTELVVEEVRPPYGAGRRTDKKLSTTERNLLEKLRSSTKVFLDGRGREWTSEEFAGWLGQQALHGARELAFVVGGSDGFSTAFRKEADLLLALSRLTFTRDWARTLLLEQLYRSFTLLRGYPYPR